MTKVQAWHAGGFEVAVKKSNAYFWDVPKELSFQDAAWQVTAIPSTSDVVEGQPPLPEQRVEVEDLFLLRKGPESAAPDGNRLQLNYHIRNVGKNPARGGVVVTRIVP